MATTFKLIANPTFKGKVGIPLHGGGEQQIEFTFKHRTSKQFSEFLKSLGDKTIDDTKTEEDHDIDYVMDVTEGWELTEPFTRENVATLLAHYLGASTAIGAAYTRYLYQVKQGNSEERRARSIRE